MKTIEEIDAGLELLSFVSTLDAKFGLNSFVTRRGKQLRLIYSSPSGEKLFELLAEYKNETWKVVATSLLVSV